MVPENAEGKMVAEALKQSNPDWVGGNHTQAVKLAREVTEAPKLPPLPGLVLNEPGAVRWMRILHAVAAYHNVDVPEILGRSRKRHVIQARFEVFYRLRVDLNFSYTKIAGLMKKDHSTVLHGVNKLRAMILDGCCEEGDDDAPSDTHPSVGTHSPQSVGPIPPIGLTGWALKSETLRTAIQSVSETELAGSVVNAHTTYGAFDI